MCEGRDDDFRVCVYVCVFAEGLVLEAGGSGTCDRDDVRCVRLPLSAESLSAVLKVLRCATSRDAKSE